MIWFQTSHKLGLTVVVSGSLLTTGTLGTTKDPGLICPIRQLFNPSLKQHTRHIVGSMMTRSPAMATRRDQKTQVIPFGFLLNRGNDSKVNLIQQCPQIPVGGRLRFFSGKLEKNNGRSMGLIFNRGGLQTRVHSETPSIWDEGNNSAQKEFRYFKCRSGRIIKKRCYRKSTSKREGMRFLQHLLSSSQEERKNETSNKFETPKQVSEERTFQNGHIEKSHKPGETKR